MWLAVFRYLLGFSSALAIGWAIRLLDDALDQEVDQAVGRKNLCSELQAGTTAYALAAMALAVIAAPTVALSLFAGAYAIGMMGDARLLPTHLPAWLEGVLLWGLVLTQVGLGMALAGLFIMLAAQLIDDLRDLRIDRLHKHYGLCNLLGPTGTWLAAGTAFGLAVYLHPALTAYALPVFLYFQWREQVVEQGC